MDELRIRVVPTPWNKGKLVGQKAPLKLKEIWAIRVRLQVYRRTSELALFDLGIDSKLRACDLLKLKVRDVRHGERIAARAIVVQQKTSSTLGTHKIREKGCSQTARRAGTGKASRAKRRVIGDIGDSDSRLARSVLATSRSSSVILGGPPPVRPTRFAAASPARVRSRMRARSNSASALNM